MSDPYLRAVMELKSINASGHPNSSAGNLSANVEDWGSTNVRHHIRQQGIQIAQGEIDMAHDVIKVHASAGGWDVKAVLLPDDETDRDELLGELFASDSWNWGEDEVLVQYYNDKETSQQEEIRKRAGSEVAEKVEEESDFDEDILSVNGVTIREKFADRVSYEV